MLLPVITQVPLFVLNSVPKMLAGVCSIYAPIILGPVLVPARTSVPLLPELLTLTPLVMFSVAEGVVESFTKVAVPVLASRNVPVMVWRLVTAPVTRTNALLLSRQVPPLVLIV